MIFEYSKTRKRIYERYIFAILQVLETYVPLVNLRFRLAGVATP